MSWGFEQKDNRLAFGHTSKALLKKNWVSKIELQEIC